MQTILGSGGSIGTPLAKELKNYTDKIRLVSRNPKKVNDDDELVSADLVNPGQTSNAVKGSDVVYLVVGLPYKIKAWRTMWPKVMMNTINACKEHGASLVFLDNIYMYDPQYISNCTEETPVNPSSEKGKVRAKIAQMILDEVKEGDLKALIARAPDFYGPGINNSMFSETILKPLKNGKKANWLGSEKKVHSFIWTPDAAKATAILGNDDTAFGQVWHLPTAPNPLTGKQYIEMVAKELGVKPRIQVAGKNLVRMIGLFNPVMKEIVEMMYQYEHDYIFISKKFEKKYNFNPTSYDSGIKKMVETE